MLPKIAALRLHAAWKIWGQWMHAFHSALVFFETTPISMRRFPPAIRQLFSSVNWSRWLQSIMDESAANFEVIEFICLWCATRKVSEIFAYRSRCGRGLCITSLPARHARTLDSTIPRIVSVPPPDYLRFRASSIKLEEILFIALDRIEKAPDTTLVANRRHQWGTLMITHFFGSISISRRDLLLHACAISAAWLKMPRRCALPPSLSRFDLRSYNAPLPHNGHATRHNKWFQPLPISLWAFDHALSFCYYALLAVLWFLLRVPPLSRAHRDGADYSQYFDFMIIYYFTAKRREYASAAHHTPVVSDWCFWCPLRWYFDASIFLSPIIEYFEASSWFSCLI